jgi:hypothetical protein
MPDILNFNGTPLSFNGTPLYYEPIITNGLRLYLDASKNISYPRSGDIWYDMALLDGSDNGSLTGSYSFSSIDNSISFSSTYVNTNITQVGCNNTTQSVWYKWNGVNQQTTITYMGSAGSTGMGIYIHNGSSGSVGSRVGVLYGGSFWNALNGSASIQLVSGSWNNLTLTRDSTTTILYNNGVFFGSTTSTPNGNTSTLSPGFCGGNSNGNYAMILYYNRALTSTEVLYNYNNTKLRFGL